MTLSKVKPLVKLESVTYRFLWSIPSDGRAIWSDYNFTGSTTLLITAKPRTGNKTSPHIRPETGLKNIQTGTSAAKAYLKCHKFTITSADHYYPRCITTTFLTRLSISGRSKIANKINKVITEF